MRPTREDAAKLLDYNPHTGAFTWKVTMGKARKGARAGSVRRDGYEVIVFGGRKYLGHRLAWLMETGDWPPGEIDHIDRVPGNNAIANLRLASHSQNMHNGAGRTGGGTHYRGVSRSRTGRSWRVRIRLNGEEIHLGTYKSDIAAARAYDAAARKMHGEFACLNFKGGGD
jgi:hypothetical protein